MMYTYRMTGTYGKQTKRRYMTMLRLLGILALGKMIFGDNRHSFPGSLLLLPALMFGGWIAITVVGGVFGLIGSVIGGVFSGLASLAPGAFSGRGIVFGIVIGIALYFYIRRQKDETTEEE